MSGSDVGGSFDPGSVEILSVRLGRNYPFRWAECDKDRWEEVMEAYSKRMRTVAAKLAGHGYDVLLIDGRVLLAQPSVCRSTERPTGFWLSEEYNLPRASSAEIDKLYANHGRYEGHSRLFAVPEPASPESPQS